MDGDREEDDVDEEWCATCRYWLDMMDEDGSGRSLGFCKRFPPVFVGGPDHDYSMVGIYSRSAPVVTDGEDWCGEWKPISLTLSSQSPTADA